MQQLSALFHSWAGVPCEQMTPITANGSGRRYFRLSGGGRQCVAALNDDVRENDAFVYYSNEMLHRGLPVPEVYAVSHDRRGYLQQDLGDLSLYGLLQSKKAEGAAFDVEVVSLYRQVLDDLAKMQVLCRDLDFERYAMPRADFDSTAIMWDLNYFKYDFLKLVEAQFDEALLQRDFESLTATLLQADCRYFLYRDFQPRNVMLCPVDGRLRPYFIDYQGARRGAPQYDVASMLFSAKSAMPQPLRNELLHSYVGSFMNYGKEAGLEVDETHFMSHFPSYVMVRMLQTLGAYGYRGCHQRKAYFLESIPIALANAVAWMEQHDLPLPHVYEVLKNLAARYADNRETCTVQSSDLVVDICSFSFKGEPPSDESGNGGGFVFDCRALPNPGRYEQYKTLTGRNKEVQQFLQAEPAVAEFLGHAESLVGQAVRKYMERGFTHLSVAFGCTGGQHRSVYCAEQLAARIKSQYPCQVHLTHTAHPE
ncbi:MAG: phosphotransferase [Bacteroidales bacterium]|nr:phosphotransferase [Bacteroidales bacterium]